MPRDGQPTSDTGWCAECHEHCYGVLINDGIGSYEYWGQKCRDDHWISVSNCCNAEILAHDPEPHCDACGKRVPQEELDENSSDCAECANAPITTPTTRGTIHA